MNGNTSDRPDLGPEKRVRPRDIQPGQDWIWRQSPHGHHGGWYLIMQTLWKPAPNRQYYVRIDRPEWMATLLADHFYLAPTTRVTVRRPRPTNGGNGDNASDNLSDNAGDTGDNRADDESAIQKGLP